MERKELTGLRWLNGVSFAAMIAVNALASLKLINGVETGDVSDAYPNLFTPAPITFAIWGAIYLLLLGFTLYQAGLWDAGTGRSGVIARRIGGWFALSCVINIAWVFCWHFFLIGLSALLMFALLLTLIVITRKLQDAEGTWVEGLLARAPFSVYYGWATVAAIAGVCPWLVSVGWDGWGVPPETWTIALLALGLVIAGAVILRDRDWVYGLTLIWAYAGILYRHASAGGYGSAHAGVIVAAGLALAALIAATVWATRAGKKRTER